MAREDRARLAVEPSRHRATSTGLMERETRELAVIDAESEVELDEFVEFFTHTRPDLAAIHVTSASFGQPAPQRSRPARATERVMRVAVIRPDVSLEWVARLLVGAGRARAWLMARTSRRVKLPPLWLLANALVALALIVAFVPQMWSAASNDNCAWYSVQAGDTLAEISRVYDSSVPSIASANHLQNVNVIHINQRLCIPIGEPGKPLAAAISALPMREAPHGVRAFIAFTLPFARQASQATGWPVSMILAQWGLETGWRTYTFTGYNWGNCGAMPGEPTVPGTSAPGSPARFSFAYSPEQGVAEYTHVAGLRYYTGVAPAWRAAGADAAARALGSSPWDWGHYTDRSDPGSSLIAIMQRYDLYWYDAAS